MNQLPPLAPACHHAGCAEPVVGTSITSERGEKKVCRRHNEREWGEALLRSPWYREMGLRLLVGDEAITTPQGAPVIGTAPAVFEGWRER